MSNTEKKIFRPFRKVILPILNGETTRVSISAAHSLGIDVQLIGLLVVPPGASASEKTEPARKLRGQLQDLTVNESFSVPPQLIVSQQPWKDLWKMVSREKGTLLLLEYPTLCTGSWGVTEELLSKPPCDLAIIRGPWPEKNPSILIPVRGGPSAELALRLGMSFPKTDLDVIHFSTANAHHAEDEPFKGLEKILPTFPEVHFSRDHSDNPVDSILTLLEKKQLLILGAPVKGMLSAISSNMLFMKAPCAVIMVRRKGPLPERWSGTEGAMSGAKAISLLVDRWFAENTYHASEFDDLQRLVETKEKQNLTISLALPALNEEETVGTVIQTIKSKLMDEFHLLDEIVLIDSTSSDRTREIARQLGIPVYIHQELLREYGPRRGKGEALWKSLLVTRGDIVVWIDTDIVNIHPRFVYGVLGPLLVNPRLQLVKGFYQRPLKSEDRLQSAAGGRVTELTARPMINLFYPELSGIIQPLAGEYGGRRKALEQISFSSGYGVEIGMIIEIFEKFGLESIGQVDLLERIHHNQTLEALSKMSFVILQAIFRRLERRYGRSLLEDVNKSMKLIHYSEPNYFLEVEELPELERPPMVELPEYRAAHHIE
ncbi:glucosyl-3-phosphoglycerate synthase [Leptolinea tardivitalis]|nr:glucosyl-3-phosphoglycerate synthase [Leptolinea tardivitalis]GAP20386.1 glycosyltransferase [Leptolinea tardivitalis]